MRARRDVPEHVFVVVPETAPSLGTVEHFAAAAASTPAALAVAGVPLLSVRSPGLHRRPSTQCQISSGTSSTESTAPNSPTATTARKPVTNVAFVMGTFFSWSGECSSRPSSCTRTFISRETVHYSLLSSISLSSLSSPLFSPSQFSVSLFSGSSGECSLSANRKNEKKMKKHKHRKTFLQTRFPSLSARGFGSPCALTRRSSFPSTFVAVGPRVSRVSSAPYRAGASLCHVTANIFLFPTPKPKPPRRPSTSREKTAGQDFLLHYFCAIVVES